MPMDPFIMKIPWAGSLKATIKLANDRVMGAIGDFAKANKIEKKQVLIRYLGSKESVLTGRVFRYSVGRLVEGIGRIDQQ